MVSFIEGNQWRSIIFFLAISLALFTVGVQGMFEGSVSLTHAESKMVYSEFRALEAALAGVSFWLVLSLLVGIMWSRFLFGSVSLLEVGVIGGVVGTAAFPLCVGVLVYALKALNGAGVIPQPVVQGGDNVYALLGLVVLLLMGGLMLVGREVVTASRIDKALV